jgi:hypothetical protein
MNPARRVVVHVLAVAAALLAFAPSVGYAAPLVRVAVEVFTCTNDRDDVPTLSVIGVAPADPDADVSPHWSFDGTAWQATVDVREGRYIVDAKSDHCSGATRQWYAVPGETRHIALTLNQRGRVAMIDQNMYGGVIYGSLPTATARVQIMSAVSPLGEQTRRDATIDGRTYQVTDLPHGTYVVRIDFGSVIVSRSVTLATNDSIARSDLSADDASEIVKQQARGSGDVKIASNWFPTQTYRLGDATADGWRSNPLIFPSDYNPRTLRLSNDVLEALLDTQQFLVNSAEIPQEFRSLSAWSVHIRNAGNRRVIVDLFAVDSARWSKEAPAALGWCVAGVGMGNIVLNFDETTGKVAETPTICPNV